MTNLRLLSAAAQVHKSRSKTETFACLYTLSRLIPILVRFSQPTVKYTRQIGLNTGQVLVKESLLLFIFSVQSSVATFCCCRCCCPRHLLPWRISCNAELVDYQPVSQSYKEEKDTVSSSSNRRLAKYRAKHFNIFIRKETTAIHWQTGHLIVQSKLHKVMPIL